MDAIKELDKGYQFIKAQIAELECLRTEVHELRKDRDRIDFIVGLSDDEFGDLMNSERMMPSQFIRVIDEAMEKNRD